MVSSARAMSSAVMLVKTPVIFEDWRSSFIAVWAEMIDPSIALVTAVVT